jgi:PPK2 family polyphosphate:nucleotide phosphotransferase
MNLSKISTKAPRSANEEKMRKETEELILKMRDYQQMMYAQNKYSILIIFQWMDASGKDNAIKKVFSGLNPLGCNAIAFKKPTEEEYAHDFLWRIHQHAPARGMVQIFNRSYYEDILVPTVEKIYEPKMIKARYEDVNNFEKLLADNDTIIIKFFLHISPEKQEEKIKERLVLEHKFWKFDPSDIQARKKRTEYQAVYESIFEQCKQTPWHIIPADQKWYKNYLIAKTIVDTFEKKMKLERPDLQPWEEVYQKMYAEQDQKEKLILLEKQLAKLAEENKKLSRKNKKEQVQAK